MKAFQRNSIRVVILFFIGALLITACKKDEESKSSENPVAEAIDPGEGKGGDVLALKGSGLGDITSILFEKDNVPAGFNPNFNTNTALVFRVPDTASGGVQNIIITNRLGKQVKVSFNVLALPLVSSVSNYNFVTGTEITLTGNNFADVTSVTLQGTSTTATIVSKTKKVMVIRMPATTLNSAKLVITNPTGPSTTTQEFVNLDKAFQIFTDDYQNGFQDASWGDAAVKSTTVFKSGTASIGKKFVAGQWQQLGFGWNNISNDNYQFLSFWAKGGTKTYDLYISTAASEGGFASTNDYAKVTVPANVWTYFKLPIGPLKLWNTASSFNQIGWRIKGPDGADETFYLDDVIFIK